LSLPSPFLFAVSRDAMGKKVKSPCVDVCKMDKTTGWCRGCLRTKDEIKRWKDFSKKERAAVVEQIERRGQLLKTAGKASAFRV
jgi:uncharacterized protein